MCNDCVVDIESIDCIVAFSIAGERVNQIPRFFNVIFVFIEEFGVMHVFGYFADFVEHVSVLDVSCMSVWTFGGDELLVQVSEFFTGCLKCFGKPRFSAEVLFVDCDGAERCVCVDALRKYIHEVGEGCVSVHRM